MQKRLMSSLAVSPSTSASATTLPAPRPSFVSDRPRRDAYRNAYAYHRIAYTWPRLPEQFEGRIARCKEYDAPSRTIYPCESCDKIFASKLYHSMHLARHTSPHRCEDCGSAFQSAASLRSHKRKHRRRSVHVCEVCRDEFKDKTGLARHMQRFPGVHKSQRAPIQITAHDLTSDHFSAQVLLFENSVCHITTLKRRTEAQKAGALQPGRISDRMHDGPARLDSAPRCLWTDATRANDFLHTASFHPLTAEPGEITALATVNLNDLFSSSLCTEEYRLFFVAVVKSGTLRTSSPSYRVTVMFARQPDWKWAEEHLIELDMDDNPLLQRVENISLLDELGAPRALTSEKKYEWRRACRFSPEGCRDDSESGNISLKVAISGEVSLGENTHWIESSKVAQVDGKVHCTDCSASFGDYNRLFDHRIGHFPCEHPSCDYVGTSSRYTQMHMAVKHGDESYACHVESCTFRTAYKSALDQHLKAKHDEFRVQCGLDGCDYETSYQSALNEHIRAQHSGAMFVCEMPRCDFKTPWRGAWRSHMLTHDENRATYECDQCDMVTFSRRYLQQHMVSAHQGLEPVYYCQVPECGFETRYRNVLKNHSYLHQTEVFRCDVPKCEEVFSSPKSLASHKMRHGTPVACSFDNCSYSSPWPSNVRRHEQTVHSQRRIQRALEIAAQREESERRQSRRMRYAGHLW